MYRDMRLDMGRFFCLVSKRIFGQLYLPSYFIPNTPTNDDRDTAQSQSEEKGADRLYRHYPPCRGFVLGSLAWQDPRANHSATEEATNTMLIYAVLVLLHSTGPAPQKVENGLQSDK
jgi:hypothetical protein